MESFRLEKIILYGRILILGVLVLLVSGCTGNSVSDQSEQMLNLKFVAEVSPQTVLYRYRFGGETMVHYLDGVESVTVYKRADVETNDQVVFNLEDGRDYVLNADVLVDYELLPGNLIEKFQELNKLYHHYDPYLQGYKQDKHREWVNDQYLEFAGRLPTEAEWMEALNELTRGVEHHQMQRWIQYSPASIEKFIDDLFGDVLQQDPTEEERMYIFSLFLDGMQFETFESLILDWQLETSVQN